MITPTRGYVLIEPEQAEEKTASGFYVPDNSKEKPEKGTVIALGGNISKAISLLEEIGITREDANVGDKVFYKKWAGTEVKADGKEYVFVKFEDILGVIE